MSNVKNSMAIVNDNEIRSNWSILCIHGSKSPNQGMAAVQMAAAVPANTKGSPHFFKLWVPTNMDNIPETASIINIVMVKASECVIER